MKHYSDIKNTIIYSDPLVGDISLNDILNFMEVCVGETKIFENTVSKILNKNPKNKEIANEIINYSMVDTIKFLIDLIKENL